MNLNPKSREPYYTDTAVTLFHGDCIEVMKGLPDASVDAVITDPPYDLTAGKKVGSGVASINLDSPYGRSRISTGQGSGGFMGHAWDSTGIAFDVETWREALRVLKPGGHLLSFGASRTWHRMAVAIEDAGFELRDSIAWLYGSGFPKSMDVSKAIDKRPGVMRHREFAQELREARQAAGLSTGDLAERVVGTRSGACWNWEHHQFPDAKWWPALRDLLGMDGAKWDGVIAEAARKVVGRANGAGSSDTVSLGRFSPEYDATIAATDAARAWQGWGTALKPAFEPIVVGRKPIDGTVAANVLAHGTGALNIFATRVGDGSDSKARDGEASRDKRYMDAGGTNIAALPGIRGGSPDGRWPTNVLLDGSQADALDAQTGILTSGKMQPTRPKSGNRKVFRQDAAAGYETMETYGDSGGASRFFPTFRYEAKAPQEERPDVNGVQHPTVKPLELMRWLVRLVTPPNGVILEPFAGSGTTVEAALLEGFSCIAIEREETYLPLITSRIRKPLQQSLFGDWDEAS